MMTDTTAGRGGATKRGLMLVVCLVLLAGLAGLTYLQIQKAMVYAASFSERSASGITVTAQTGNVTQVYRTVG
ncbi:MAG: hypothetical protein ACI9TP_002380 [Candidatus Azotimanducaceae bacterium]|jgi:hypothetical protein